VPSNVLVVGATGNVGSAVVNALVSKGVAVRGLARTDEGSAAVSAAGAEAVVGELTDRASLMPACDGIETVFIVTRGTEQQVEMAANAIEAAKAAGVVRIVRMSAFVPEPALEVVLGRQHAEIEQLVRESGVPSTIIKPIFFMQNLLGSAGSIAAGDAMYWPWDQGRAGMVDIRDIVDVAVEVMTTDGHEGKTYTLTGPASISMADAAAALSKTLGRTITYVDVPPETNVELIGMGMSPFMAETNVELIGNFATGGGDRITDDVERVAGHPARSIDDFARDFAGMFAA
jgi:uncharacterized protein YbjT (DUF2867 family)